MNSLQTRGSKSETTETVSLFGVEESPLFTSLKTKIRKKISDEFTKYTLSISIDGQDSILSEVLKICEATDKEGFKVACTGFVKKCRDCGLPYGGYKDSSKKKDGFRKIPLLWTNQGLNTSINPDDTKNKDLLKEDNYLDYISDTESPPFRLLWNIIPEFLTYSDSLFDKIQFQKSYLYQIREKQKKSPFNQIGKGHIPYDIVLSEVWTEEIPKMLEVEGKSLSDVKIEYGQSTRTNNSGKIIRRDSVFCTSELPIFLKIVAEHNKIADKNKKITLPNDTSLPLRTMLNKINDYIDTLTEGKKFSTETAYDLIKDFLPAQTYEQTSIVKDNHTKPSSLSLPSKFAGASKSLNMNSESLKSLENRESKSSSASGRSRGMD